MTKRKPAPLQTSDAKVRRSPRAAKTNALDPQPGALTFATLGLAQVDPHAGAGRPTLYTPDVCAAILERLEDGMTLSDICNKDDRLPFRSTVRAWMKERPDFKAAVALARETAAYALADRSLEIADGATRDTVQVARLRAEIRLKLAGAFNPGQFGDRKLIQASVDMNVQHGFDGLSRSQRETLAGLLRSVDAVPIVQGVTIEND